MSLTTYNKKRNFKKTSEPQAYEKRSAGTLSFVVQRHKASHLHYDFRLEMDGVLKSWAIPKGPSMNPGDKRLAMMVEDHPYDYKDFAGIIPQGNYGAGIVEIWDNGYYTDIKGSDRKTSEKNLREGLKNGSLKFILHGKKLNGEFALVQMKTRGENAWLLIKHRDEFATDEPYHSEEETPYNSPINEELRNGHDPPVKKGARKILHLNKLPQFIKPMLAKETDKAFNDKDWIFEIKWDGYRAIAEIKNGNVRLYSRNGNSFNDVYPLVVQELSKIKTDVTLDGEVVALDKEGKPSFQLLQDYRNNSSVILRYYVFDILSLQGKSTTNLALIERKKLLQKVIKKNEVVRLSDYIETEGKAFFDETGKKNLEGIMAKKKDSFYVPGIRTANWLKIKHHKTLDAIIIGFTRPRGNRHHFGSLILATKKEGELKYIGHTGSGFNARLLSDVSKMLEPLVQAESPIKERIKTNMPATWVRPVLVCEVKYTEITNEGILRHPIFLHMRTDKTTKDIQPTEEVETKTPRANSTTEKDEKIYSFGKIKVTTTHNKKIFWPEEGITKGDVIEYYQSIADYILPYLADRPESLRRNPNGIKDAGFFQKDMGELVPDWIKTFRIFSESTNKNIDFMLCNDKAALAFMNNLGCIEINPMHSTIKSIEKPDYLIIDIDPSEQNTFDQVIEAALTIHKILDKAGASNYCKTSGATGMHIYVPTGKKYTYEQVKDFAKIICMMAQEELPDFTTLERNLSKRGKPNIYLDHLQNRRGQTIASVYSLRPYPGASISTPLDWREVKKGLDPKVFNINTIHKRLQKTGDIFSGILGKGIGLNKCLDKLGKDN
jgi:bifunctional non-homologous end joining protein LigD